MRIRFAPSPTGFLHIGNARTAIINHLIAKKTGATFVLRIEDTDLERSTRESEESIKFDLKWLGIEWNEGPDEGGPYGPYRQSDRFDIYREYTEKLIAQGKAYHCFCTQEELDAQREICEKAGGAFVYTGKCRSLTDDERKAKIEAGIKSTIRFRVNEDEAISIDDRIKGNVLFSSDNIGGDFIIVRTDGVPVFNYIVVIDDALMKITHVIRGEDHLPNTPKQVMIARALGFESPVYAHLPLVLGDDRKKLSKRHGITSVMNYRDAGYLPEALLNYIAMLGWASSSGEEILPVEKLIEEIDLDNLGKSASVFDFQKLKWMNSNYIRTADLGRITDLFIPYLELAGFTVSTMPRDRLEMIINLARNYCELLADIPTAAKMFLEDCPEPDAESEEILKSDDGKKAIHAAHEIVNGSCDPDAFAAEFANKVKAVSGLKGKALFHSLRALLTSTLSGPDLVEAMKVLGFELCKKRINSAAKRFL